MKGQEGNNKFILGHFSMTQNLNETNIHIQLDVVWEIYIYNIYNISTVLRAH